VRADPPPAIIRTTTGTITITPTRDQVRSWSDAALPPHAAKLTRPTQPRVDMIGSPLICIQDIWPGRQPVPAATSAQVFGSAARL